MDSNDTYPNYEGTIPNEGLIKFVLKSAEFRNCEGKREQIKVLRKNVPRIRIQQICKVLGISTKTYYRIQRIIEYDSLSPTKPSNSANLTFEDERLLLDFIYNSQVSLECTTSNQIIEEAENIYFRTNNVSKAFGKDWVRGFVKRHSETIEKKTGTCY